jgi:ATP-binding cassette subfamily B (MDR/TAP) protein 1
MLARSIACVILALVQAPKFSSVFLAIFPFAMVATVLMVMMIKKFTIKEFQSYGSAGRIAQESLSSIRTVLSLGLHRSFIQKYSSSLKLAESMAIKKGFWNGIFAGLAGFLLNFAFAIAIYYGVLLVRTDCENYNAGRIMQSFFCMMTGSMGLGQALPYLKDLAEARGAAAKVYALIDKISDIDVFTSKGKELKQVQGNIEFKDVVFSYPERKDAIILKGLNLNIPAGKTIALVGSSGGGKSTVISLLQRFYLPTSGQITIDGEKIEDLDLNWFRSQMALVSQEPILFTNTIKENIRLGRLDATDLEIEAAAKMANAHDFIMQCSKKYETPVGERGLFSFDDILNQ